MKRQPKKGILFDSTRCIGCGACYEACKERNHLPRTTDDFLMDTLSAQTYTVVKKRHGRFVRQLCMHCEVPACASVCPVAALEKTGAGPVVYHEERCIGCRYCMVACPFGIPRYEWGKVLPRIRKCDLCADRVAVGQPTACAQVCPTGATRFGDHEELIEKARARIRARPEGYIPHIYGLEEVGGTSVLLLSDVPLQRLGYRNPLGKEPLPLLTWNVLKKIPNFALVGGVLLYGIWWITNRRIEVQRRTRKRSEKKEPTGRREVRSGGIMTRFKMPKATFWRGVLFVILTGGLYSTGVRFTGGLGASTALSDQFPWGLWVGFDVLCGVALAAGGFTLSAVVYLFHLDRFKPIIRPTILTAFLGYLLVIVALLFDLGRPYRIWHPLVMGNPHSVMFEVAWCVMLYTTVLALELSPMLFERLRMEHPLRAIRALTIPLVILGVILSMLHQSSLGSLYLIVPGKLHPLWYSPLLPLFFFISALGLGCAMIIFESFLSFRAFRKRLELDLLADLGKVIVVMLAVYLVLKVQDLMGKGSLGLALVPTYEGRLFLAEMLLGVVAPIVLLVIPPVRTSHFGMFVSSLMVVLGFIMNRLNVSITGMETSSGVGYLPSWTEASVTLMIVALGFVLFGLAVKYLPVFPSEEPPEAGEEGEAPELPAPAALRRPLSGSALLVLALGGLSLAGAVALAYSGIRHRAAAPVTPAAVEALEPDTRHGLEHFKMPPDVLFPRAKRSPGRVTFSHDTHVDLDRPRCTNCHSRLFEILKARQGPSPMGAGQDMHARQRCGACHDGRKAFDVKEDCAACHEGMEE